MGRSIRLFMFAVLVMTTMVARAAGQSHGDQPQAKEEKEAHGAPAPTKEAPRRPLRRQVLPSQRNRQLPMPVERRWELIWPAPDRRVALTWHLAPTYPLSWDDHSETPLGAAR